MQAHTNPREKTRDIWKNPGHDSSDTQYIQATSRLIQQDSVSTGYTASRHHDRGCMSLSMQESMSCCDETKMGKHITTNER